ncbi:MAG: hypothetical protein LBF13_03555, partial [Campylobacteraceae bacterium]|nr:hypothetical protein [Campylobacteraceae bacterium]
MLSAMTNFKTLYFIKIKASSLLVAFFFSFFLIGCESKVDTAAAVITVQPVSKLYIKDDTAAPLNVTVKVKDKGIISYQWYSNTVNSNENGNAIQNAVQQTYTPSTLNTGKTYYYAVVTNTNSNKEISVNSDTAEIIIIAPGTTVDAATPVITEHPKNDFYVKGDTAAPLSVNATVDDKGTLSYQWYSNTVNSNENGTLIPNGTKQTYKPSTSKTGTFYYYTVVTSTNSNVNGKKEISVKSDTVKIEVSNTAVTTYSINFYD